MSGTTTSLHDLAEVIDTGGVTYSSSDPSGDLLPLLEALGKLFLLSSMMGSLSRSRFRLSGSRLEINRKMTTKKMKTKMTLAAAIVTRSQMSFLSLGISAKEHKTPTHHFGDSGFVYRL